MKVFFIFLSFQFCHFILGKVILSNNVDNTTNSYNKGNGQVPPVSGLATGAVQGSQSTTGPTTPTTPDAKHKVVTPTSNPIPSETFTHMSQMDTEGKYFAFWKSNDTHITIELHVKTRGYIGFGISPHGSMYPADVVFGWVSSSGTVHLKDCHTVGHVSPVVDQSQDIQLLHGEENNFGTVIKFVRKLDTCDSDDIEITDDTMRLIYAYHPDDPSSIDSLVWHGASRRGTRSVLMLSGPKISVNPLPSDSKHFDFTGKQIHVPGKDTTYMCTGFKFPQLDRKHHMIKYVPIVQPGNERHVHHIVLHYCTESIDSSLDGVMYECYKNTPPVLRGCYSIFLAWAVGGQAYEFPADAGMPLGTNDDPKFFILETHYDNPTLKTDIVDSSGIRIIYTPTLRKHDAASLLIGELTNRLQIIPPFEKDFLDQGFCSEECLRKGLDSKPDGINVFAVFHHMHLLGRKIQTRIVRNGTEIAPIATDDNYDFDYQDIRVLSTERKIYAGDRLILDCHYDSSKKKVPTYGGLSTREEMCYSFLMYYPKSDVQICISQKTYDNLPYADGLHKNVYQYAEDTLATWNWTDPAIRQNFKELIRNTSYDHHCSGKRLHPRFSSVKLPYPEPDVKYVKPQTSKSCNATKPMVTDTTITTPKVTNSSRIVQTSHKEQKDHYTNKAVLDRNGSYIMYWRTNSTHIIVKLHVKTRGYIGFGISPNGKMYPADVVVGWIDGNGQAHLKDYHTTGHTAPILDQSQDWVLLYGEENNNGTILKFTRKLDTCDPDDIKITDDTVRVIYSYHPSDPTSPTSLPWHGASRRGTKSLMLLSGPGDVHIDLPADTKTFEFRNNNFHVPGKSTYYRCSAWKFPDLGQKHHMMKYEPIITPGNELNVHHILIYHCTQDIDPALDGRTFDCYTDERPQALQSCYLVSIAWVIGGGAYYYPDNVGVSLGTSRDPSFFVMETHYDNPTIRTDMIDNSGIRIYYSPTLRQHDAGMLYTGQSVNHLQIIPPFEDKFLSRGFCSETCLRHGLSAQQEGIKVFGVLQHSHLLGRGINTRIVRNGIEQKPLASDNHFDFDYQDFRVLKEERTILPGDSIMVDCIYNSSKKSAVTYGGLSTRDEMCISFVMYYPRIPLSMCVSEPKYENVNNNKWVGADILSKWNWKDPLMHQRFQEVTRNSTYSSICSGTYLKPQYMSFDIPYSDPQQAYTEKNTCPPAA